MKIIVLFLLVIGAPLVLIAQKVKISTESGEIVILLEPEKAPITVENFMRYVVDGYYEGGSFFRTVKPDNQPDSPVKIEVIQGGCRPMMQSILYDPIPLERTSATGLRHLDGTVSMARGEPDTAQDSFFICIGDQPELDFGGKRNPDGQGFAAFGTVLEGMDIVRKIQQAPAEGQSLTPSVIIHGMEILD